MKSPNLLRFLSLTLKNKLLCLKPRHRPVAPVGTNLLASSEAYLLLPSFPSVASSNERGRLLTCNGEAVIEREAMFAQARRSEFL